MNASNTPLAWPASAGLCHGQFRNQLRLNWWSYQSRRRPGPDSEKTHWPVAFPPGLRSGSHTPRIRHATAADVMSRTSTKVVVEVKLESVAHLLPQVHLQRVVAGIAHRTPSVRGKGPIVQVISILRKGYTNCSCSRGGTALGCRVARNRVSECALDSSQSTYSHRSILARHADCLPLGAGTIWCTLWRRDWKLPEQSGLFHVRNGVRWAIPATTRCK